MASPTDRLGVALRTFARPWELAAFAWAPAILLGLVFFSELRWGGSLGDFTIFRSASHVVLHGGSPYVAADPHVLARNDKFVYPPITGILFAPFAVLPLEMARVLMLVTTALAILVALRLLGVSDWRCYGLALLTAPVVDSISIGALSPFLLVGAAAAWRFRDRSGVAGPTVALTAVAKLFLWPLGIWLIARRRLRATALAAGSAVALVLGGWAVIGFAGFVSYPHLLHVLSDVEAVQSYSLVGLFRLTGVSAEIVSGFLALAVIGATVAAARGSDGDRRSFAVAVAGAVLAAPVLWIHYFVLLLAPLALYRPRLSPLWFVPLAFWATPLAHSDGSVWKTVVALLVGSCIVIGTLRTGGIPLLAVRADATQPLDREVLGSRA